MQRNQITERAARLLKQRGREAQKNTERENDREQNDNDFANFDLKRSIAHAAYYYGLSSTAII
jgi:hypothetical protein